MFFWGLALLVVSWRVVYTFAHGSGGWVLQVSACNAHMHEQLCGRSGAVTIGPAMMWNVYDKKTSEWKDEPIDVSYLTQSELKATLAQEKAAVMDQAAGIACLVGLSCVHSQSYRH